MNFIIKNYAHLSWVSCTLFPIQNAHRPAQFSWQLPSNFKNGVSYGMNCLNKHLKGLEKGWSRWIKRKLVKPDNTTKKCGGKQPSDNVKL